MKDLIRNYKLIIKDRHHDESDDSLVSSASSHDYGSCGYVFGPGSISAESEEDTSKTSTLKQSDKLQHARETIPATFVDVYEKLKGITSANLGERYDRIAELGRPKFEETRLIRVASSSWESHSQTDKHAKQTNSSIVTIFAIWNTTMGSSLLATAWGFEKSGFFPAIIINIMIASLCLYTAYILLGINKKHGIVGESFEVPELCRLLLGRWAETLAKIFSMLVLIGADIVYWILMSNFLYNLVLYVYDTFQADVRIEPKDTVICFTNNVMDNNSSLLELPHPGTSSTFYNVWDLYSTVPIFLAVIMFPVLNFKNPTFFTKFNSLGTISVTYLLVFTAVKSMMWGVHMQNWSEEWNLKSTFPSLSGMLSMSYFIHNIIITVMRQNKHQEKNGRDLTIAFSLILFTYVFIGAVFYIGFPLAKSCIGDNLLNNFAKTDTMTIIARVLLLFQLFTVFPLITYMLRNDILTNLNGIFNVNYSHTYGKTVIVNSAVVLICITFACFLPRIGTLIRYTGAISGLVYIFLLPSLLKMTSLSKERRLTVPKMIFFSAIVLFGGLNLFSQFFISDNK